MDRTAYLILAGPIRDPAPIPIEVAEKLASSKLMRSTPLEGFGCLWTEAGSVEETEENVNVSATIIMMFLGDPLISPELARVYGDAIVILDDNRESTDKFNIIVDEVNQSIERSTKNNPLPANTKLQN